MKVDKTLMMSTIESEWSCAIADVYPIIDNGRVLSFKKCLYEETSVYTEGTAHQVCT